MSVEPSTSVPARRDGLATALAVLFGVTGLGSAAVAVVLPVLAADLDLTPGRATLVVSCYSLALAVGSAVYGRLGDILGIRGPLVVGIAIMVTAACAGALTDSLPALVAARALQGLGAAAVPALTLAAVQAVFEGDSRARAMATYAAVGATVNALGPVVGAMLVEPLGWRPVVAIPVATLLLLPVVWRDLPTRRQPGATLDAAGAALVAVAAVGAVLALQAATLGVVVALVGLVCLVVALPVVVLRSRRRPDGIVPAVMIADPASRRSLITAMSLSSAWFGMLVAVPTTLVGEGWSGVSVGLLLVPCAAAGLVAPRITGPALVRLGPARAQLVATLGTALALLLATLGVGLVSPAPLVAATVVLIVSFGLGQPAMTTLVADAVPLASRGGALGLLTLVFLMGGSLGAAAVGGLGDAIGLTWALLVVTVLPLSAALAFATLPTARPDRPADPPRADPSPTQEIS
ncbi:MFS transporter [Janibacter sp. UYMM211]|uniref:MFS transporter n=1 Tax=Janibacter sp. UYMM211 TaxID=3156342 RepID=UPI00339B346E